MSDDDFLTEMAKDQQDGKHTKQVVQSVVTRNAGKQPGKPASQTSPKGPQGDSGKKK
jgi:hypothetical protein